MDRVWSVAMGSVLAGACLVAGGCQIAGFFAKTAYESGSHQVFSEYEGLAGHDFAVVVNADQVVRSSDPRLVNRMTNAITRVLSEETGATGVVPGPMMLQFQYNNPSWPSWSYERLAQEFTVDRLVIVDLFEYRLNEPGNRFVWDGRAAARVSVFEAGMGGADVSFYRDVQVRYPDQTGVTRTELQEQVIVQGLEVRLVNRVCWLFFDHEEPNTIEY